MSNFPSPPGMEITPAEAQRFLEAGQAILIDVREPHEFDLARIEGARLIPMHTLPGHLPELASHAGLRLLVVYCHHGVRSLNAVSWLRRQGIGRCVSMTGGIDLWSRQVDGCVPRY